MSASKDPDNIRNEFYSAAGDCQEPIKDFYNSEAAILLANNEGRYLRANPAACFMLDYSEEELLQLTVPDIVLMDVDGAPPSKLWDRFITEGHPSGIVSLNTKSQGRITCLYNAVTNVLPGIHLSILTKITPGRQLQLQLEQSEQRYRSLFEHSPNMVVSLDHAGVITAMNKAGFEILGYCKEEIVGRKFIDLCLPQDCDRLAAQLETAKKGQQGNFNIGVLKAESGNVVLNVTLIPLIINQNIHGVYIVALDLTETSSLIKAIQNEKRRFSALFYEAPVSMAILKGEEHVFEKANSLYYKLSGRKNIIGRTVRGVFPEAEGQGIFELMDSVYNTGQTYRTNEQLVRLDTEGNGILKDIYLDFMFQAYRDNLGTVAGIFFFGVDVTKQVDARKRIESNEKQVKLFARQLNQALEDERSRMAREIHDEFGQQLTGLKMSLHALKSRQHDLPKNEAIIDEMLTGIENTIGSLRKIATELRPSILDTLGLLPSIQWLAQEFEKKTCISCRVDVHVDQIRLDKDTATAYFRICQEALTNILKHANATKVVITIKESSSIFLLKITDNGKGIREDMIENPFSMGMIGMRERASLIGASMKIYNEEGGGVTIEIIAKAYG
jgi:PAS domain S-box-containing protein